MVRPAREGLSRRQSLPALASAGWTSPRQRRSAIRMRTLIGAGSAGRSRKWPPGKHGGRRASGSSRSAGRPRQGSTVPQRGRVYVVDATGPVSSLGPPQTTMPLPPYRCEEGSSRMVNVRRKPEVRYV